MHVDVSQVTFRAPKGPGLASTSPGPRTSMKVGSFNARRTASSAMTTGRKKAWDEDESVSVRLIDDFERRRDDLGVATTYRARSAWKEYLSSSPRRTPSQIYASEQPGNAGVARDEPRSSLDVRFAVRRADATTLRRSMVDAMTRDNSWEKARRKAVLSPT